MRDPLKCAMNRCRYGFDCLFAFSSGCFCASDLFVQLFALLIIQNPKEKAKYLSLKKVKKS
jgi:hypothetical protein